MATPAGIDFVPEGNDFSLSVDDIVAARVGETDGDGWSPKHLVDEDRIPKQDVRPGPTCLRENKTSDERQTNPVKPTWTGM